MSSSKEKGHPVTGPFASYEAEAWPHSYEATVRVTELHGGVPFDPKKAESWIRSKVEESDDVIQQLVAETFSQTTMSLEEAQQQTANLKTLTGFRRNVDGHLIVPGYHVKAALKEAVGVALSEGKIALKWGGTPGASGAAATGKSLRNYFPEHVFVNDREILITRDGEPLKQPDDISTRFCHTWNSNSIKNEEVVFDAELSFSVKTDSPLSERDWAMLWLTAELQGLGTARSQGFGVFKVTRWDRTCPCEPKKKGKEAS